MTNLVDWLEDIKTGRGGWIRVYKDALRVPIADPSRFFSALETYGDDIMMEAILITASKNLDEPLSYLLAVASTKAVEAVKVAKAYERRLEEETTARGLTRAANEEMATKIKRAREIAEEDIARGTIQ